MARCEDAPCCGHALNECPTGPSKECPDCGHMFEPTAMNSIYCLACGSLPMLPKVHLKSCGAGNCDECGRFEPRKEFKRGRDTRLLCEDCLDEWMQAAADDEQERRYGDY